MIVLAILITLLLSGVWSQQTKTYPENDLDNIPTERENILREAVELGYFFNARSQETNKIANGQYAEERQFPFVAAIHKLIGDGNVLQCGGTVISKRWVLTAGHCIVEQPRRFLVVFGITSKQGIGYDYYSGPGVSMITTQGAVHPQYRTSSNDIGLLYMPQDIPFSRRIQPITLAGSSYARKSFTDRDAYVIGWGRDRQDSYGTEELKFAMLPIISTAECRQYWDVDETNICTSPSLGGVACHGDSGGPLVVVENGQFMQVGIVSYGDSGCPSSRPGVYTKVPAFLPWIERMVKTRQTMSPFYNYGK